MYCWLLAVLIVFHFQESFFCADEVQFSRKIESKTKGDYFGTSIATSFSEVVIGAPYDNNNKGSVTLKSGTKLSPPQGNHFGKHVGVNENFIVVSGEHPTCVYVFNKTSHDLKVQIPLDNGFTIGALQLTGDNETAITTFFGDRAFASVYAYDKVFAAWHLLQKIQLPDWKDYGEESFISVALWDEMLAVGYRGGSTPDGHVVVYKKHEDKHGEKFIISQIIKSPQPVHFFGVSTAIFGTHLAISSYEGNHNVIFTYQLDDTGESWTNNGKMLSPGQGGDGYYGFITIEIGTMAVTVTDMKHNPDDCAYIYEISHTKKISTVHNNTTDITDGNNNIKSDNGVRWEHIATLKTKGEPLKSEYQSHASISIKFGVVYTGRVNAFGVEKGAVFVHELPDN